MAGMIFESLKRDSILAMTVITISAGDVMDRDAHRPPKGPKVQYPA